MGRSSTFTIFHTAQKGKKRLARKRLPTSQLRRYARKQALSMAADECGESVGQPTRIFPRAWLGTFCRADSLLGKIFLNCSTIHFSLSISNTKTLRLRPIESYLSRRRSGGARASIPAEKKIGQRILCSVCGFTGAKSGSRTYRQHCGQHQHDWIAGGEYDFQLWGDAPQIGRKVAAILSRKNHIRQ